MIDIVGLYRRGMTVDSIARLVGVNPSTVHRRLRAAGVPPRGPAGRRRWAGVVTREALERLAATGCTVDEAAVALGAPRRVVLDAWQRCGLDPDIEGDDALVQRYHDGASIAELAIASGVSERTVARRLRGSGVELRPVGRPGRRQLARLT